MVCVHAAKQNTYRLELDSDRHPSTRRPTPPNFEPPPDHIRPALSPEDIDKLSDEDLERRDYPTRPDLQSDPVGYRRWRSWVSRPVKIYKPELIPSQDVMHPVQNGMIGNIGCGTLVCNATAPNWSGFELAVMDPAAQRPYGAVSGRWRVPDADWIPGYPVDQEFFSSTWIGLDGDESFDASLSDLAQGGTETDVGLYLYQW